MDEPLRVGACLLDLPVLLASLQEHLQLAALAQLRVHCLRQKLTPLMALMMTAFADSSYTAVAAKSAAWPIQRRSRWFGGRVVNLLDLSDG